LIQSLAASRLSVTAGLPLPPFSLPSEFTQCSISALNSPRLTDTLLSSLNSSASQSYLPSATAGWKYFSRPHIRPSAYRFLALCTLRAISGTLDGSTTLAGLLTVSLPPLISRSSYQTSPLPMNRPPNDTDLASEG